MKVHEEKNSSLECLFERVASLEKKIANREEEVEIKSKVYILELKKDYFFLLPS